MTTTEKREDANSTPEGAPFTPEVKALLAKIRGSMAESMFTVDDYLEAKHAGVDAENAVWEKCLEEGMEGRTVDCYLEAKHAGVDAENAVWERIRAARS